MTTALMALREAVNNTCRFLGPGSRTGANLENAMRAVECAGGETVSMPAAAGPAFDKGPWAYRVDQRAESHAGRYFVESDDSEHDVRLYINGDFGSDEERRAYGEALAATLNRAAR